MMARPMYPPNEAGRHRCGPGTASAPGGPAFDAPLGARPRASKIGCTGETLRKWVRQGEGDSGVRPGPTTSEQLRIKELEREVRELRKSNEILKLASAYFAQAEFDRQLKK